uniref:Lipase domain-containing protein n=1 Tax=Megaselia scalaris TaxID=36166 RepID=T1GM46_MEGSC
MGCHLAGRTGRTLQSLYNNKLNNIVGIDCAGPMFKGDLNSRIQDTDANNVISLMCSYAFGPGSSIYGTHNYIVNNGGNQPACASDEKCMDGLVSIFPWTKSCSHAFCCNLVAELLSSNSSQFFVSRCDCFTKCTKSEPKTCPLSLEPNKNCAPGLFSVYTNNNSPYAMGEEGAKGCKGCSDCYNCYPSFATVFSFSGDGRYCY